MKFKSSYKVFLIVLLSLIIFSSSAQQSISSARVAGAGATVTVKGIVTNGSELGVIRYIQDKNAGISVYATSLSTVNAGDSLMVTGTLVNFNNLLEMSPVTSFKVISKNNPMPAPLKLKLSDAYTERYEGMLVEIDGATLNKTGPFQNKTTYTASQNGSSGDVYVNTTSGLIGANIPSGKINIIGIMSQFKTFYQLLPRYLSDIVQGGPILLTDLVQTDIKTTSFTLAFTTQKAGSTIFRYGLTPAFELGTLVSKNLGTDHNTNFSNLYPATFYYVQGISVDASGDSSASQLRLFSTASLSSGRIQVFFNHSIDSSVAKNGHYALNIKDRMDDSLVAYIKKAKSTLDIAIYSFNQGGLTASITDALNDASVNRRVRVRIVANGNTNTSAIAALDKSIHVIYSPNSSGYTIMHNKFMVVDADLNTPNDPFVWTGSTNWTQAQFLNDYNNVIIIQDQTLAMAYHLEFELLWGSTDGTPNATNAKFGQYKTDIIPHKFMVNGKLIELYFSPSDGTNNAILNAIGTAEKEFYFSSLDFTRTDLANAIKNKVSSNGVFAAGVIGDTSGGTSAYNILTGSLGNNVRLYNGPYLFHHKYGIVDPQEPYNDPMVITGSHNWTNAADQSNDENILIVHDATIANLYYQEWMARYKEFGGKNTYTNHSDISPELNHGLSGITLKSYFFEANTLMMNMESDKPTNATIYLQDMQGRIISCSQIKINIGENKVIIPENLFKSGMYLLHYQTDKGGNTVKIIKL